MKRFLLPLLFLFLSATLNAQIDNTFWFVAPEASINHGDRPVFLRISTMEDPAIIRLSMPANPAFTPISTLIAQNTTYSIDLTPWIDNIENKPADAILNNGLYLISDNYVTAYYEIAHSNNPAIFPLKGRNGLGTDFYIVSQNNYPNQVNDGSEAFDIIATEDSTWVTITPKIDITGHPAGVPFLVFLNKGQTYSARTTDISANVSLAGSHITSTKPIAITISDDSIITGGWDIIGDQIIPVDLLGKEHIVVKGYADNVPPSNNDERVYVLATQDNTNVFLDGNTTPYTTLNTGDLLSYGIANADPTAYVKTSEPVYVYHLSGNPGEAGASLIPHDSCTGSRQIGFNRTSASFFAMVILTRAGNEDGFVLNGGTSVITPTSFSAVNGTGGAWMYTRMSMSTGQVPVGNNLLQNTKGKFHLGIINNLGGSSEYGFYSAYSSLYLGADRSMCHGDSIQLDAGPYMNSYEWYRNVAGTWTQVGTSRKYMVHDTGYFAAVVVGDYCQLSDTIHVAYYPSAAVSLGNDTTICEGTTLVLDPGAYATYMWQNGGNSRLFNVTDAGQYWVRVTNGNGCAGRDTINVAVHMKPRPGTPIVGTTPVCQGQGPVNYAAGAFTDAENYTWTLPSGYSGASSTNSIDLTFSTSAVSDTIRLTSSNYCGNSPGEVKLGITVNPLPSGAQAIAGPASVCQGQNGVSFSIPAVENAVTYNWILPAGGIISAGSGTNSIEADFALNALPGKIRVNGQNGCGSGPADSIPLAVNLFPLPASGITGTFTVCQGATAITYAVPPVTGADQYIWTLPSGGSITSGTGTSNITVKFDSSALSGNISVFGRSLLCGDGIPSSAMITVNPLPVPAGAIVGPIAVCQGQTGVIFSVPLIANADSYIWTLPAGATISSGAMTSTITVDFSNSAVSGNITVHGSNVLCGNGVASSFPLTVNPLPAAAGTITGPSPVCQATSGKFYEVPVINYADTYTWNYSGSGMNMTIAGNTVTADFSPAATSGSLSVKGNNACGDGPSSSLMITVNPMPFTTLDICDAITTRDAKPFPLDHGVPKGGLYTGSGVSGTVFNPAVVPPLKDTVWVNYTYTNTYGCINSAGKMISIIDNSGFTCGGLLTDVRDNKTYPTISLGSQCWMAVNLDHGAMITASVEAKDNCIPEKNCFSDNPLACSTMGGLYDWSELMQYRGVEGSQGLCPPGWHVPTESDWNILFAQFTNRGFAGSPLKITGFSGFAAGLYGERFINNQWEMDNFSTFLWSSSPAGFLKVWAHGMNSFDPSVSTYPSGINNAFSVRCIKD